MPKQTVLVALIVVLAIGTISASVAYVKESYQVADLQSKVDSFSTEISLLNSVHGYGTVKITNSSYGSVPSSVSFSCLDQNCIVSSTFQYLKATHTLLFCKTDITIT